MGWIVYRQIPNRRLYKSRAYGFCNLGVVERADEIIVFWDGHELTTQHLIKTAAEFNKKCHVIQTEENIRRIKQEKAKVQAKRKFNLKKEVV